MVIIVMGLFVWVNAWIVFTKVEPNNHEIIMHKLEE